MIITNFEIFAVTEPRYVGGGSGTGRSRQQREVNGKADR